MSRPTTPTQNRLKLKRSTTEDAVADERLWPLSGEEEAEDAEAGMGGGRPTGGAAGRSTGGGGRDYPRAAGRRGRDASWTARARRRRGACRPACWSNASTRNAARRWLHSGGPCPRGSRPRGRGPRAPRKSDGDGFTETYAKDPFLKEPPHGHFYASQRASGRRPGPERREFSWPRPGRRRVPAPSGKARPGSGRSAVAPPPNIDRSGVWDKQNDPRNCSMFLRLGTGRVGKIYPYLNFTTGDPMNSASAASTSLLVVSKDPRSGEAGLRDAPLGEAGSSRRMVSRNGSKWNGLAFLPGDSTCRPKYAGDAPTQDVAS